MLLEAATAWRRAGEQERAIAVFRGLVGSGGEERQFARVLLAAELFEERGDLAAAGEWYDAAAAVLTDDELAALGGEFGWASYAAHVLLGRSRVRQLLGVPTDEFDDAVRRARERSRVGAFSSADDLLARRRGVPLGTREVRTLFWQRAEFHASRERWPALFDGNGTDPIA